VELGGFVEHLHDEGHTEISFDDFILMLKTVNGGVVEINEDEEEKAMVDALEAAADYVLTMGRPPPQPEEIQAMEQKIVELQDQIGSLQPATSEQKSHESELLEDDQQELEKAWIEEKTKVSHAEQAVDGDSGAAQIWASMSVLDFSIKVRVSPLQLRKVGAIIKNMQGANYSDEQINDVCRALFLTQSEEDMAVAWKVFDADESGFLDGEEFKKAPEFSQHMKHIRV